MAPWVLLVDDEADLRAALRELLEFYGYRVEETANGLEALERMRNGNPLPSVALVDLMMPTLNGWELIEIMRTHDSLSRVPVVVLSAMPNEAPEGVADVIGKPIDTAELLAVIARYCPRSR